MSKMLQKLCYLAQPTPSSVAGKSHIISPPPSSTSNAASRSSGPVHIVELFQSEGCNTCPPTNEALLALLPSRPDILLLSYNVTYWDYIGWKDVFGDKANDGRQREYAVRWHTSRVYTPQVIVNGRQEAEGSGRVVGLIEQGIKVQRAEPKIEISVKDNETFVNGAGNARPTKVMAVFYDTRVHDVPVTCRENRGVTLRHQNVVRRFATIGTLNGGEERYELPRAEDGLRVAILVQEGRGGNVLAGYRL